MEILHSGGPNGAPKNPDKYIVAREDDYGLFWYYGSYDDANKASQVARKVDGEFFDKDKITLQPYYQSEDYLKATNQKSDKQQDIER